MIRKIETDQKLTAIEARGALYHLLPKYLLTFTSASTIRLDLIQQSDMLFQSQLKTICLVTLVVHLPIAGVTRL